MNEAGVMLHLCLFLFGAVGCYDEPQFNSTSLQVEERAKLSLEVVKKVISDQDFKRRISGFIGKTGGTGNLININYSASPKQVIKAVGDAMVPLISAGLALIPGGGLIGGIVEASWGIFSGIFCGPAPKSPMELMIEDIQADINNIKNNLAAFKASLNNNIQKQLDATLSKIINKAINGEIRRNEYICSKYAILSGAFSHDLKNNLSINESIRIEMVAQIHDCDNFLKDTVEAFVYPEYADVLWIPNAITTLARVAFLTEITNYGVSLGLEPKILSLFWSEMKADLKRVFEFYSFGVKKKTAIINAMKSDDERQKWGNFTIPEYEGCVMQAQLLYFDSEMYPFGVPNYFRIFGEDSELKIADYNVSESDKPQHIQVYYNEVYRSYSPSGRIQNLFNCFSGPDRIIRVPYQKLSFHVRYVPNKTYEMRVLYFAEETSNRTVTVDEEVGNNYVLSIDDGDPSEESVQRFVFNTSIHQLFSTSMASLDIRKEITQEQCYYNTVYTEGAYIVETVLVFTVQPNDKTTGKIEINWLGTDFVYLFGVEFIVQPLVKEL